MRIDCRMEIGIGKHEIEDRVLIQSTIITGGLYTMSVLPDEPFVVAVADGVGGNKAGNFAAHIAVEGLVSMKLKGIDSSESLTTRIRQINERIIAKSQQNPQFERMASTLSGLYFTGKRWMLFHVGNSRIYCYDTPYLKQVTDDHTLESEMFRAGLSEEEIQKSGNRSTITACLGNGNSVFADKLQVLDVTSTINSGKSVFLTSDGVHDFIPHSMLEHGISSGVPVQELLHLCMKLARERGSTDDLSMVCVSFSDDGASL